MQDVVLILHILACLVLIVVVLLQSGKEGMGVIFGGGGSSLFGSSGAGGLLVKITALVAALFLATSLGYNVLSGTKLGDKSSILDLAVEESAQEPDRPAISIEDVPASETSPGVSQAPSGDKGISIEEPEVAPVKTDKGDNK